MNYIVLQLHITGRCNLRCKHCYISEHTNEMSFANIKRVVNQFYHLSRELNKKEPTIARINITGGEIFCHKHIYSIIRYLIMNRRNFVYGVMTNGTMLNSKNLRYLKRLKPLAVQVSLDGNENTHDSIRGVGNFKSTLDAIDKLYISGLHPRVSFTANKTNYAEFSEVANLCYEHNASTLWSDRYIPINASDLNYIDSNDMAAYVDMLRECNKKYRNINDCFNIENCRALQFIGSNDIPYSCKAGEHLIVVDENGNIMPCRRMPIVCGNINDTTLTSVYFEHPIFKDLRSHTVTGKCTDCEYKETCRGGAKCMAYAINGDYNAPDPSCYI